MNEVLKIVSISDIHFGSLDPEYTYNTLRKQFIQRLYQIKFDILAICGDIFDAKFMSNNPIVSFTLMFMNELVNLCRMQSASLILIDGTQSHDNGQLSLFYHYLQDPTVDVRIVEQIRFEKVKGLRILCIPERYGIPEEEYNEILFNSGGYDLCLLHGTLKGSYKGSEIATLNTNRAPVFGIQAFSNCRGPILAGHYHIAGCYQQYMYYNGSALRFAFGEEEQKGFLITLYNPYTRWHYTELVPIESYIYKTININKLLNQDPKVIIDYIKDKQRTENIDFIRVQFNNGNENMSIVRNYFRNNGTVKLDETGRREKQFQEIDREVLERNEKYSYLLDDTDDYTKFVQYINQNEGSDFISVDELISLLEGK